MKKLTAEKCREQLDECRALKERGYLSINGEYKLQALEIALPVLEQQERGEGEWIEWDGGDCPVGEEVKVDVRFRNGEIDEGLSAGGWVWLCSPESNYERDIIAYRVVQQERERGEEE